MLKLLKAKEQIENFFHLGRRRPLVGVANS